jgi:hypothetical protein
MSVAIRSLLVALIAVGCATGGNGSGDDAPKIDAPTHDAPHIVIDAKVYLDAHTPTDGQVPIDAPPPPPDASTSGGLCAQNTDCTTTGECCLTLGGPTGFCVPGIVIGGACFPQ